ncbi:MAG: YjgP/YjgQ family permease [Deltaproteobacteria bacterium]|nr:MAG: YjgP/YjgQ family permease [Deltaproteobacteria bacterium]
MPSTLINRYLLRELATPTLLGLLVFTLVLIAGRMVQLADLVINKGVSFGDIATLLVATLPPFLSISIPLAFLMGIMLGMGRLSADNEIIALKTAGIGLSRLARPVIILALASSIVTALMSWWLAPWGNRTFRTTLFDITSSKASVALQPQTFVKQFDNMVFYADGVDPRSGEVLGVFIVENQERGILTITAERGKLTTDPEQQLITLSLYNGHLHRENRETADKAKVKPAAKGKDQPGDSYQVIRFSRYDIRPAIAATPTDKEAAEAKPKDLGLAELLSQADGSDRKNTLARAELHRRFCTPLAPLVFALLALPFSTHLSRSGRGSGFIFGMAIYLAYHFLISLAETLTGEAGFSPVYSFWLIHAALAGAGLYLVRLANLERPIPLLVWLDILVVKTTLLLKRHVHS